MRCVSALVVLSLLGAGAGRAAGESAVRTRAGWVVRRRDDGGQRVSEYFRRGVYAGRVTSWRDGRITVERAVHGSLSTHYRIANFPGGGVARTLEWNQPGDRGGWGKIVFGADGTRRVTGSARGPVRLAR
jgi:hypothetical protein